MLNIPQVELTRDGSPICYLLRYGILSGVILWGPGNGSIHGANGQTSYCYKWQSCLHGECWGTLTSVGTASMFTSGVSNGAGVGGQVVGLDDGSIIHNHNNSG